MGGLHIGNRQGYDVDSCSQFEREAERLGTGVQSRDTIALTVRFPRCLPRARYGHELRKPPGGEGRSGDGRQRTGWPHKNFYRPPVDPAIPGQEIQLYLPPLRTVGSRTTPRHRPWFIRLFGFRPRKIRLYLLPWFWRITERARGNRN